MKNNNDWFAEFEKFANNKTEDKKIEKTEIETPKEIIQEPKKLEKTKKKNWYYFFLIPFFLLVLLYIIYPNKFSNFRKNIENKVIYIEKTMDSIRYRLHGGGYEPKTKPIIDTLKVDSTEDWEKQFLKK